MSRPTARRPRRQAAPHRAASGHRLAVAGGAALAVAVLAALPVPAAAPGVAAAVVRTPSPATLFALGPATQGPLLRPAATEDAVAAATPPGTAVVRPAASVVGSPLAAGGIPATALAAYRRGAAGAPRGCGIDWSLLAAIGRVESNHGRYGGATLVADGRSTPRVLGPVLDGSSTARIADTDGGRLDGDATYDRAVGPMQFIPSTWVRFAVDGDGDGVADPFDIHDAAAAAAGYLCVAGGDLSTPAGQARAVLAYNHSDSYVATVLTLAAAYAGGRVPTLPGPMPPPTIAPVDPARPPALGGAAQPAAPPTADAPVVLAGAPAPLAPAPLAPAPLAAATTTPGSTTAATTTPGSTTAATATPGSTTPATTTPASTTAATTTPASSTPATTTPASSTPATTTPGTTTPGTTTAGTTAPDSTPDRPPAPSCPVLPRLTVDVVNDTGDPAVAEDVTARLQSAGLTIGSVTSGTGATTSSLRHPAAATTAATQLATALGLTDLLQEAHVDHVTFVLAGTGADAIRAAVDRVSCPA